MKQSRFSLPLAKYMWMRFLTPLFSCLIAFTFLFVIMDAFDVLQDFLSHHASFTDLIDFFISRQPERLVVVAPIAFLLAALYTFADLSKHNEIVAVRSAGLSVIRICLFIWLTGLAGTVLIKYTMDSVVPSRTAHANYLEKKIGDSSLKVIESRVLAYRSRALHRDWVFGKFSLDGEKENVVVTQFRPDRSIDWEIRAERAIYTGGSGWLFEDGQFSQFDEHGELLLSVPEEFTARRFPELSEKPKKIRNSLSPVEELSTSEIKLLLKNNEGMAQFTIAACETTIYYRMFFPFACVIALLLAIPLSIKSGRGGIFANLGIAVGGMLSYYGVLQAFLVLGKKGFLSPLASAIIPTAAYLLFGLFLTYKKR